MSNIILGIIVVWLILGVIHMLILNLLMRAQGRKFKGDIECFSTLLTCIFAWPLFEVGIVYGAYTELTGKTNEKLEDIVDVARNDYLDEEDS